MFAQAVNTWSWNNGSQNREDSIPRTDEGERSPAILEHIPILWSVNWAPERCDHCPVIKCRWVNTLTFENMPYECQLLSVLKTFSDCQSHSFNSSGFHKAFLLGSGGLMWMVVYSEAMKRCLSWGLLGAKPSRMLSRDIGKEDSTLLRREKTWLKA